MLLAGRIREWLRKTFEYPPSVQGRGSGGLSANRKLRCGPWDKREDGAMVCRKCGDVEPEGTGPFGF